MINIAELKQTEALHIIERYQKHEITKLYAAKSMASLGIPCELTNYWNKYQSKPHPILTLIIVD